MYSVNLLLVCLSPVTSFVSVIVAAAANIVLLGIEICKALIALIKLIVSCKIFTNFTFPFSSCLAFYGTFSASVKRQFGQEM